MLIKLIVFLTSNLRYVIVIYIITVLVLVFSFDLTYSSDSLYYYKLAQQCIELNEYYPAEQHLYEDYIFAPLYINVIIILLKVSNSPLTISVFNFLTILFQLLVLYKIASKIFSSSVAQISILIYIFYLNTVGLVLQNYTELFFVLMISLSIYLFLLNKNHFLVLSGIILGGAIAVRPTGWVLLLAFVSLHICVSFKYRKLIWSYFFIYTGVFIFILCFGGLIYSHFGKFEYQSTTGPVNLLIGANDDATGGFKSTVFDEGKAGYIENPDTLTYIQKGDFYQGKALDWIKEQSVKWISLAPLKLLHAFGWDDIALSHLIGFHELNFGRALKNLFTGKSLSNRLGKDSWTTYVFYFSILFLNHIYYFIVLVTIALGIIHLVKNKSQNDGTKLILFFLVISIVVLMIIFGSPRFKYPIFIMLCPFAAYYLKLKIIEGKKILE
ncbi:MAG: glycosyltransferase family 39 protein [Ignavibacteria bacterium]|nr:glycosyltransferase family 39 protein [Ignavibacteria bacterium]MBT8381911.1 glycosyltransferase family 39 protein [Ignavibacteria bacterium]MBT8390594.1 glycosyltransferase family 39 protein [Ignavibacteria bacterium]NNL22381.1 hypothetical protein [Ignavibacteriaceae bacterium]